MKVLVVDDDESIRRVLSISLTVEDPRVEVREASSGIDAIEIAQTFHPHIILLDYWMPRMDGRTAAAHLREMSPESKIVAFSGVLEEVPEWADALLVKGDIPGVEQLLDLRNA